MSTTFYSPVWPITGGGTGLGPEVIGSGGMTPYSSIAGIMRNENITVGEKRG